MSEPQLFKADVDFVSIAVRYFEYDGWVVRLNARREGGTWADSEISNYDHLTKREAVQVLEDALWHLLRIDPETQPPF